MLPEEAASWHALTQLSCRQRSQQCATMCKRPMALSQGGQAAYRCETKIAAAAAVKCMKRCTQRKRHQADSMAKGKPK